MISGCGARRRGHASAVAWLAVAVAVAGAVATATAAAAPAREPAADGGSRAVTVYPAAYFADQQPTTAFDMVLHIPGFAFDNGADVRGFSGSAANVVIDGARPASKDDSLDQILRRIPAAQVLRIELIRGSVPGIDMQGRSVIANIVRRKIERWNGKATGEIGRGGDGRLYGDSELDVSRRVGAIALDGSLLAGRFASDGSGHGVWRRADQQGRPVFQADERQRDYETKYKVSGSLDAPLAGGELKLNGSYVFDVYRQQIDDRFPMPEALESEFYRQHPNTGELGLRFERKIGKRLKLEVYGLDRNSVISQTTTYRASPTAAALTQGPAASDFANRRRSSEKIVQAKLRDEVNKDLSLEAGAEFAYNRVDTVSLYNEDGAPLALPAANVVVDEARWEAFATGTWAISRPLTFEGSLRFETSRTRSRGDANNQQRLSYLKPRLQMSLQLDRSDLLRVRLERQVGQLNFDDFIAQSASPVTGTVRVGNPRLRPDQDWTVEVSLDHQFWDTGLVSVAASQTWKRDARDRIPVLGLEGFYDAPGNIGSAQIETLTLSSSVPLDKGGLKGGQLSGSATLRWSRVTDPTTGRIRPLSQVLANEWNFSYTQGLPRWQSSFGIDLSNQASALAYRFDELDVANGILNLSLHGEYKAPSNWTMRVDLSNVADSLTVNSRAIWLGFRSDGAPETTDAYRIDTGRMVTLKAVKAF